MHKITNANIKEWAASYDGPLFDGILCDPPYELGFMGKSWDSSGIAFDTEMWADLFRHIKPGGHLLAFSGSRTYHRMAVAIEDAGFEIRDMIEWVYGSGFPKSLNIGKAVDKIQGNEREELGIYDTRSTYDGIDRGSVGDVSKTIYEAGIKDTKSMKTKGNSPYEGYGTALKPAHEPCVLARKPLEKGMTVATNVLKHGTGGLAIDKCRIGTDSHTVHGKEPGNFQPGGGKTQKDYRQVTGRFPSNLILDGSDEVVAVFPSNNSGKYKDARTSRSPASFNASTGAGIAPDNYGDSGSASRFFYTAKASKSERNAGLEGFPKIHSSNTEDSPNPKRDIRPDIRTANHHPTVKPLSLTKYLATLIKPPTGGRLLVPFSGSGSEMIGALQAGWEYVEGVELTEEYIPIAEARIKYWLEQMAEVEKLPKQVSLV